MVSKWMPWIYELRAEPSIDTTENNHFHPLKTSFYKSVVSIVSLCDEKRDYVTGNCWQDSAIGDQERIVERSNLSGL